MQSHHLEQINVATSLYPLDDSRMSEFINALGSVNAIADSDPGFIWRLQDDSGSSVDIRDTEHGDLLINMSVWRSVEALHAYVFRTMHSESLADRKQWFHHDPRPTSALWWVPAGEIPSVKQGLARLDALRELGPRAQAFTFRQRFDPSGQALDRS